jgi:hypothetical protein
LGRGWLPTLHPSGKSHQYGKMRLPSPQRRHTNVALLESRCPNCRDRADFPKPGRLSIRFELTC